MGCLRFLRKKVILSLSGLLALTLLSVGVAQPGWAAVETVETFGLVESGGPFTQTDIFNDGSVIYVRVDNEVLAGSSFANVIITDDDDGGNSIIITVYDNGYLPDDNANDIYWWGKFTLRQGDGSGTGGDILELSDTETVTISADLDSVDGPGTKQITAGYSTFTDFTPPVMTLLADPSTFSPDGDGVQDTTTISFTLDDNVSTTLYARLEIRDNTGNYVIKTNLVTPSDGALATGSHSYTWDGKDDAASYVPDETYVAYLLSVDGSQNSAQRTAEIIVETTEPEITDVSVSPSTMSPENGDGNYDTSTITFKATNAGADLTFEVYAEPACSTLVRVLTSLIQSVSGNDHFSVTWDGKDDSASYVDDGEYTCKIEAESLAEESAENTDGTVTVDNTAPSAVTNLSASAVAGGDIELSWTASSSVDADQYNIYQATSSGGQDYNSPLANVPVGTNSYTDTSTSDGVTYYYVVRTQDTVANIETNTTERSATASASGPSFSSITADSSAYKDGDTIELTVTLANHNTGCTFTADFSNIDSQYVTGGEAVVNWGTDGKDNDGDGHIDNPAEQGVYVISYLISLVNTKADSSYSVPVTATDAAANSTSSSISLDLDNTAPPAPTGLTASAIVGGSIQLNWTASSPEDDVASYNIYQATSSGGQNYSSYTYQVSSGTTTYTDTATTDGTTYYYVVRAQDAVGNIESNTKEVSATASGSGPPAPTGLTATAIAGGSIQLDWTLSSPETDVAQYNIYRAINSGEQNYGSPLTNVSTGTNTYTDTTTTDGETYYYVVRARDAVGNTETNTNEASATADATAPPAPTNLAASTVVGSGIQLSWTRSSPETDVSQYNIYRATSSGGQNYSFPSYSVSAGNIGYTDTSVSDGATYYYVVRAQDAASNIETNTNEVWATVSLAGPSASVSSIYIKYEEETLYDLASSTNSGAPAVFAKGKIDEIYLRLDLVGGFELNQGSSSVILFRGIDEDAEEVLGSKETNEGTGWAEFIFHIDPSFDPDVDEHSRDALYWVDVCVVSTTDTINDFDFYFIYDTTSPAVPDFGITSFDPSSGTVIVSGKARSDCSDPQQVEIFFNSTSQGVVTADGSGNFSVDNLMLAAGDNHIAVQSTDRAGNKSALSDFLYQEYNSQNLLSIVIRSTHVVKSGSATIPVTIIYAVTEPAQVTIHIHNLLGETVKEWSQWVNPGEEPEWRWLGENMYGETVNNGVYIVRVIADNEVGRRENVTKLLGVLR